MSLKVLSYLLHRYRGKHTCTDTKAHKQDFSSDVVVVVAVRLLLLFGCCCCRLHPHRSYYYGCCCCRCHRDDDLSLSLSLSISLSGWMDGPKPYFHIAYNTRNKTIEAISRSLCTSQFDWIASEWRTWNCATDELTIKRISI